MKKSKQANTPELEDGVDKISNLPDHVLQLILSDIQSTEEVIRTSILSTRWRYLWTSLPFIDIDYTRGLNPLKQFDSNRFREFVYWVLLNKPLDLDSFHLRCDYYYNMVTLRQWIHTAVMRKVKLLDLTFCPKEESEDVQIPHSLVTCDSLEVLKLCLLGSRLCVPNITGFQALRVLELKEVYLFIDNLVGYFLESCPLLEDLSLIDCRTGDYVISCSKLKKLRIHTEKLVSVDDDEDDHFDSGNCLKLEICCPNLEFLKLTGFVAVDFLFESLFSLKKAVIHAKDLFIFDVPDFDFFSTISHVESLSISLYCIAACFDPDVDDPISLPNLKTLEITLDGSNMEALIPFLKCLPDMEALHLIIPKHINLVHMWHLEGVETINILTCYLKKVEFLEFNEEKTKLEIARVLLEHGNELEEMVFKWGDEARLHERSMETMNQVASFKKASSTVKLRCSVIDPSQIDSSPYEAILDIELIPR